MEVEILKEALDLARVKKPTMLSRSQGTGGYPVKRIAETLGMARSNLIERAAGKGPKRGPRPAPEMQSSRLISGAWWIPAGLWIPADRRTPEARAASRRPGSCQRQAGLPADEEARAPLARRTGRRVPRAHDGTIMTSRSNERWCSDALEFTCWNGEIVRVAFALDSHDREVISGWRQRLESLAR